MSHTIMIGKSDSGIRFYLPAAVMQHLGGPASTVLCFAKRESDGRYSVFIRENIQGRAKIVTHNSAKYTHKIDMRQVPAPFDRWPMTPVNQPGIVAVTFDSHPKRQVSFTVDVAMLAKGSPGKKIRSTTPSVQQLPHGVQFKSFAEMKDAINKTPDPKPTAHDLMKQALPDHTVMVTPQRVANDETPHQRFARSLKALNETLTIDLNDIELFIERIDAEGSVVETIVLPVPSQMRIKGRIIREETFG